MFASDARDANVPQGASETKRNLSFECPTVPENLLILQLTSQELEEKETNQMFKVEQEKQIQTLYRIDIDLYLVRLFKLLGLIVFLIELFKTKRISSCYILVGG